jgi:hypothetical protein
MTNSLPWTITGQSDSFGKAWSDWAGASVAHRRLASRESDVVAAVGRADLDPEALVLDELRRFVEGQIAALRDEWKRGEPTGIKKLFLSDFGTAPPETYRIYAPHDPMTRLVWASRRSETESWRAVVLVWLELSAVARSWRAFKSHWSYKISSLESAFWTLIRDDDRWIIELVETSGADHYLLDRLPDETVDQQLQDEAAISTAVKDPLVTVPVAELKDVDAATENQLRDLSVVDGRYAPDAIVACVCEIARTWEAATTGNDKRSLESWSTPEAIAQLCRPTPNGVRRVRNIEVRRVRINALNTDRDPPTISVSASLHGQRWLATHKGGTISGSPRHRRDFTEQWTLCLDSRPESPWQLIDVKDPGRR